MEGNGLAQPSVDEPIAGRLDQAGPADRAAEQVLASLPGDDEFSGTNPAGNRLPQHGQAADVPFAGCTYSRSKSGFRGIGPKVTLRLQPGPGLTIVAGPNVSGKSSLAEAAELAFTDNASAGQAALRCGATAGTTRTRPANRESPWSRPDGQADSKRLLMKSRWS